jgi:hypothetical protein
MHINKHESIGKTVILQAIAHAQRHKHITSIFAHSEYIKVADTINSQKSKDRDITHNLP